MKKEHPLDNLIWDSITQNHQHLAKIRKKATAYIPQVFNFAGLKENTNKAWTELEEIVTPNRPKTIAFKPPETHTHWEIIHKIHVNHMIFDLAGGYVNGSK
jgi:hypothetical protein